MLKIEITDTDNAFFRAAPLAAAIHIVQEFLNSIDVDNPPGGFGRKLIDPNGNVVGYISWIDPIYKSEEE